MTPYISLGNRAKGVVILGAGAMFFYNLLFAFTIPCWSAMGSWSTTPS